MSARASSARADGVSASVARTWRAARVEVRERLAASPDVESPDAEARWLTESASGYEAGEWHEIERAEPLDRERAHLDAMVARRIGGEPLQYVLGEWSFRGLDLMVDHRVLIPRPETELVVEVALGEASRAGVRRGRPHRAQEHPTAMVADLGTGSGAIALALEAELPDALVWATDVDADALAVARANVAGAGATRVRVAEGSWFDALPVELRGAFVLIVANPPYVSEPELDELPAVVRDHEPRRALVSGPSGMESIVALLDGARDWLAPGGALVLELAPQRAEAARAAAVARGYVDVVVHDDLTARPRVLVARAP
jgi:release factor glutamine methyltransferase